MRLIKNNEPPKTGKTIRKQLKKMGPADDLAVRLGLRKPPVQSMNINDIIFDDKKEMSPKKDDILLLNKKLDEINQKMDKLLLAIPVC